MTERPRPQYGEYASPEDQSSASGTPVAVEPKHDAPAIALYAPPRATTRLWDRVFTAILIAVGLYTVVTYFATLSDLGAQLSNAFTTTGYGEFQSVAFANQMGMVALAIIVVLYAASTTLALLSLRAKRVTFWIPLTAGALALVTVVVIMMIVVFADPGFQAYVNSISA